LAFDTARFAELIQRRGVSLGQPLYAVESTGSTNDDAMAAARAGAPHGATFLAEEQTRGRGRRGSRWSSQPGESLTFSVLLRARLPHERMSALTLAIGLAVREAVARRVSSTIRIKWPNDIVAAEGRRKLAGILLESQVQGADVAALVVGIGLNVGMRRFEAELSDTATSLALLEASDLDRESLLADVLFELEARFSSYERSGLSAMLGELRAHDALLGTLVKSDQASGIARGIDEQGALVLETPEGSLVRVVSGSISPG